jgi:hypothetical protein
MDDLGADSFLALLQNGVDEAQSKAEVLEAMALRPVWLVTWEPKAEGFRTLINSDGEEALAVFSSEEKLETAAAQFGWVDDDGTVAIHRAIGGDILRHAWTREYAFVVLDIGADHSLEYERAELKAILRDLDSTGPFRTSRPPAKDSTATAASSFPPPVEESKNAEKPAEPTRPQISTTYSMAPSQAEKLDRLSDLPTKPYEIPYDSEPPTQPRAARPNQEAPVRARKSSRPAHKPKSEPPGTPIQEVHADKEKVGDGVTYGAASVIPPAITHPMTVPDNAPARATSVPPESSSAPKLTSDAPTAPSAQPLPTLEPEKLKLPAVGPIGVGPVEPKPLTDEEETAEEEAKTVRPPVPPAARIPAPSIGDGIKLVELLEAPDEDFLGTMGRVLRGYFEVEWASYCHVARPAGPPSPAVGLRIADNFRDNVTVIIKELCEAARGHDTEIDVLLIDGHDMLRKSREHGFVFYPWKPKG